MRWLLATFVVLQTGCTLPPQKSGYSELEIFLMSEQINTSLACKGSQGIEIRPDGTPSIYCRPNQISEDELRRLASGTQL